MRTKGSCVFSTYYKVQFYDTKWMAWKDVQQAHSTIEDALAAFIPSLKCRVMEIDQRGRRPLPLAA